jgi:hypothetical protein
MPPNSRGGSQPQGWNAVGYTSMDWKQQAKLVFKVPKPIHFANYSHCCECAEHDETLSAADVDSIGLQQLGNPGWDPLCCCSAEGLIYYLPAMIRLTLDTVDSPNESYLDQMLFHLIQDGADNRLVNACNQQQREFVAGFLEYLVDSYSSHIEAGVFSSDDILRAHEIWDSAV